MNDRESSNACSKNEVFRCGFIGLGLIGGSIARALRAYWKEDASLLMVAYTPHKETVLSAVSEGIIDICADDIDGSFSDCDIIFMCAPVEDNNKNLEKLLPFLSEKTTLTDIGSVKTGIHEEIKRLGLSKQFVGGHPMTGSERIGFRNSKASLLENAYYIITKTEETDEQRVENLYNLVNLMRAVPVVVEYGLHDRVTAAISHLPHVISASLVNLVQSSDNSEGLMRKLAAGGFRDITRISSSSPVMWQQICLSNRDNILQLLDDYMAVLSDMRSYIEGENEEKLLSFFSSARQYRESFSETLTGSIPRSIVIHVDIPDQPGNIAAVATLLAVNGINIKNIGIVHNREFEHGTLSIEFGDPSSLEKATELLPSHGYPVHTDSKELS